MQSASLAANTTVAEPQTIYKLRFVLACCLFALVLMSFSQPLHAGVAPRFAYVLDPAGLVHVYSVNRGTGALAITGCVAVPAGLAPTSLKIYPGGDLLYVADSGGNAVFGFTINRATGCLAPTAQIVLPTAGTGPSFVHITADGEYLYVSDTWLGNAAVEGFSINPVTGALGALVGFPMNYGAAAAGLGYDPVGNFLLAADDSAPVGPITAFNVLAGGALGVNPPTPTVIAHPHRMGVDPDGGFVLVVSDGANRVDSYTLNPLTGALAFNNFWATGVNPHGVAVTPIGQLAYVTNNGGNSVSSYWLNPNTGFLTKFGADTILRAPALAPTEEAIDASGEFLYTGDNTGHVSIFKITAGRAVEIAPAWSPFVLTFLNPAGIAISK